MHGRHGMVCKQIWFHIFSLTLLGVWAHPLMRKPNICQVHMHTAAHSFMSLYSTCSINVFAHFHCGVRSIASTRPMGETARLKRGRRGRGEEGGHCSLSSFLSFCLLPPGLTRQYTHTTTHTHVHRYARTHTSVQEDGPWGHCESVWRDLSHPAWPKTETVCCP